MLFNPVRSNVTPFSLCLYRIPCGHHIDRGHHGAHGHRDGRRADHGAHGHHGAHGRRVARGHRGVHGHHCAGDRHVVRRRCAPPKMVGLREGWETSRNVPKYLGNWSQILNKNLGHCGKVPFWEGSLVNIEHELVDLVAMNQPCSIH